MAQVSTAPLPPALRHDLNFQIVQQAPVTSAVSTPAGQDTGEAALLFHPSD